MKRKLVSIMLIWGIFTLTACGNSSVKTNMNVNNENNVTSMYDEVEIGSEYVENDTPTYEYEEETEYYAINPCFDEVLKESMQLMDPACLTMSEEELVDAYGMPTKKDERDFIYWEFEENGIKYGIRMSIGDEYNTFYEGYLMCDKLEKNTPTSFYEIKGNIPSSDFSTVSNWFEEFSKYGETYYTFNDAYEYSTLNTYNDFVDKLGNRGRVRFVSENIGVFWYFEEIGKMMQLYFDPVTGMVNEDYEPTMFTAMIWEDYLNGYYGNAFF